MKASRLRFSTLDVFTDRVFAGNRLAVLPDARDAAGQPLTAPVMQAIAAEFGFSETVFVVASRRPDCVRRLRIFTPEAELAFAGHPTIGTAIALVREGIIPMPDARVAFGFDLDAGPTAVVVRHDEGRLAAQLTAPHLPDLGAASPAELVAAAVGLPLELIDQVVHPPLDVGIGLPFVIVRLASLEALARARRDRDGLARLPTPGGRHGVACYVPLDDGPTRVRMRVFGAEIGIEEDPATGSAAGALAGFLAMTARWPVGTHALSIEQGIEMGRPSRILAEVAVVEAGVAAVRIGGGAVTVSDGWLHLPQDLGST
ncbi:MAG: PhzF family phenazine biosynthesis protein [Geminicoccaceae bacterium]|nr:MAG: PhzF family phenazine biosynthesis protein [Geminicoccaceae bacterium]